VCRFWVAERGKIRPRNISGACAPHQRWLTDAIRKEWNIALLPFAASKDVGDALAAKNYTIDRRKIQMDEPIKQLGEYKVPVRLHKDVTAEVTVIVVREE